MAFGADWGSGLLNKISTKVTGANNISSSGGYAKRQHPMRVSAMKYVSSGFNFIVTLNEFTFGFKNVSGISVNKQISTINEGGVNDHGIIVEEPNQSSFTLSFSRGLMIRYPQAVDATVRSAAAMIPNAIGRKAALIAAASSSPQGALEKGPALGFIHVYDRTNKRLLGLYSFLSLGMTEWRVSDLDAENGSLLIEDMTIVHTGITREATALQPFSMVGAVNQESDVDEQARAVYEKLEKAKESQKEEMEKHNNDLKALKAKLKKMKELIMQEDDPSDEDLKDFSEDEKNYITKARKAKESKSTEDVENKKKEAEKAASDKAKKIEELIMQDSEPSDADLKDFDKNEQNYIKQAWLNRKTRKTDEEIEEEKTNVKEDIANRQAEIEKRRKATEEARAKATEANKKQDELNKNRKEEIEERQKSTEEARAKATEANKKQDELNKNRQEEIKERQKAAEEARAKATEANKEQDELNKERAQKVMDARKEKANSDSGKGSGENS